MTEEAILAKRAQSGNLEAFNQLVLIYQGLAFNVAYRILTDSAAADDATQNAIISAFQNLKSYRGGSFRAWLLRIVTNSCYDELRRQKRHPSVALAPVNIETGEEIESPKWMVDDVPSPEDIVALGDLDRAVQHCLDNLPDEFRVAAVLVDVEGMDYGEVSEIIGKPLGTIKSRVYRARKRLQQCLQSFQELLPVKYRLLSEKR
ncbi:MAG: sigma-70 family RNA polymerase sigma factor [Anaerolineaceae bacterium]|nr:sigma-70 family RNA polymerase sigma factor [Anaerolineaceae bacterium]